MVKGNCSVCSVSYCCDVNCFLFLQVMFFTYSFSHLRVYVGKVRFCRSEFLTRHSNLDDRSVVLFRVKGSVFFFSSMFQVQWIAALAS